MPQSTWYQLSDNRNGNVGYSYMFHNNISIEGDFNSTTDIHNFNPEISMEYEYNETPVSNFLFITDGIILTIISCFGIVGTLMSIVVLVKPRLRGNSRDLFSKFLTALALYDTLFLILAILLFGLPNLSFW